MMRRLYMSVALLSVIAMGWVILKPTEKEISEVDQEEATPEGRWEYERARLADPQTGEIPSTIRAEELAFATSLPRLHAASRDSFAISFKDIGPYNIGGRTRAFAIDQFNPEVYLAGAVSGGMWRSDDAGETWVRTTAPEDHAATSCVVQDIRSGRTDEWYFGSGETVGNSASKSFSAYYRGSGIWKSEDGGESWVHLQSTSAVPQKASPWDAVFTITLDHTRNDSDVVYAAVKSGIMRSNDGGDTWKNVLPAPGNQEFTSVDQTSDGVFYASISSDATSNRGFWRSEDGMDWVKIHPTNHPGLYERTVIAIAPSNEDIVYFFSGTPGVGANEASLWKYEYLNGDGSGSGGNWTNLTSGMASSSFNVFGGYCQVAAVKPDDEDVVFVGGTSLYRSTNAFTDTFQVHRIGGYSIDGDPDYGYFQGKGIHYPDQQNIAFHPNDPDFMISTTDGGVHLAENCLAQPMKWKSLNNGYISSQFYAIAIDHGTPGSEVVIGGLQDRGTFWTNEDAFEFPWTHVRGADGAYCEVEDGGGFYYISTQYANIQRLRILPDGTRQGEQNIMPESVNGGYLFVHPFAMDRVNNDIIYLPRLGQVWRNDAVSSLNNGFLQSRWQQLCDVGNTITAISSSDSDEGVVYFGTNNGRLFRLDSAHVSMNPVPVSISDSIFNSGYTSCIAIDPHDPDRAMAVFSNYNCRSIWYTEDGGADWEEIEGNLKGTPDPNVPPALDYIGDGPSIRWAEFVPTDGGYLYFIGTSVGLFFTDNLDGDSTVWVQQGSQVIGNVVVDMLHYRESDGKLVVGTHGNGIFTADIDYVEVGTSELYFAEETFQLSVYPNPVDDIVTVSYTSGSGDESMELLDLYGRVVYRQNVRARSVGEQRITVDMSSLPTGNYLLRVSNNEGAATRKLTKL